MKVHVANGRQLKLVIAFSTLGVSIAAHHLGPHGGQPDAELESLRDERRRLAAYALVRLQELRSTAGKREQGAASAANLAPGWSARVLSANETDSRTTWLVTADHAPSWNSLISTVSALVAVPGSRLASLAVHSRGTKTTREIASVAIVVEQSNATPSRRNPSDGTGPPGAVVPAISPEDGTGPALRRPAALAEPPGAGQSSAPAPPAHRVPGPAELPAQKPQPRHP